MLEVTSSYISPIERHFSDLAGAGGSALFCKLLLGEVWLGGHEALDLGSLIASRAPMELHPRIDGLLKWWLSSELAAEFKHRPGERNATTEKQYASALDDGIGLLSTHMRLPGSRKFIQENARQMLQGQSALPRFASKDHVATLLHALSTEQRGDHLTDVWTEFELSHEPHWARLARRGHRQMKAGIIANGPALRHINANLITSILEQEHRTTDGEGALQIQSGIMLSVTQTDFAVYLEKDPRKEWPSAEYASKELPPEDI